MAFRVRRDLNFAAVDDSEGILFDPVTMASFGLNETALWVMKRAEAADGVIKLEELALAMSEEYAVSLEIAKKDIESFCRLLSARRLVVLADKEGAP